jgi:hypothetical protein
MSSAMPTTRRWRASESIPRAHGSTAVFTCSSQCDSAWSLPTGAAAA